jgi:hypothetical protein
VPTPDKGAIFLDASPAALAKRILFFWEFAKKMVLRNGKRFFRIFSQNFSALKHERKKIKKISKKYLTNHPQGAIIKVQKGKERRNLTRA